MGMKTSLLRALAEVGRKALGESNLTKEEPVILKVSPEVMDAVFSRAAGRYCEHCDRNGSHHSDRHNDFAAAALRNADLIQK